MITKHTIYNVAELGIPTIPFEEYVEDSQLKEKQSYVIGVLDGNQLFDSKVCYLRPDQIDYINKLKKAHGANADIIIQGYDVGDVYCVFEMTDKELTIEGTIQESEEEVIKEWKEKLFEDLSYTRALVGVVVKQSDGVIRLKSIN
jgi:hypothetical protein